MIASATQLKRTRPEDEGIPSAAVLSFIEAVEEHTHPLDAVQGFMLLRHGNVAAEGWWTPYSPDSPHALYSLSKSFTSSAIGMAVQEGLLTVDDPVLKFFPDDAPASPSENLKAMRVRHLLSMNTGHQEDTTDRVFGGADDNWPRTFLSLPVEHAPRTWFVYNTAATYMLSAIITQLTGLPLVDYLRPRLFEPLGIENPFWGTDPRGINIGGAGLHIKLDGVARFGQMYLQKGVWQGRRILSEEWIAEATRATSDNSNTRTDPDWTVGYGYQFWRCRHDCYRGDGAFGQYCVIMPEQDAVLAINSGVRDLQEVLNKVWEHLLPAMGPKAPPDDGHAYAELRDKLAALSLPLPTGRPSSPGAAQWSGKTYRLESNDLKFGSVVVRFGDMLIVSDKRGEPSMQVESVAVKDGDARATLIVSDERGAHPIQVGYGTWLKGTTDIRGLGEEPVAACGAWTTEDTYEVRVCFYESEFCPIFRFHYAGDELQLDVEPNVSWTTPTVTTINGQTAA